MIFRLFFGELSVSVFVSCVEQRGKSEEQIRVREKDTRVNLFT